MPVTLDITKKNLYKGNSPSMGDHIIISWTSNATKLVINDTDYASSGSLTVKLQGKEAFYDFIATDGTSSIMKTVSTPKAYK